MKERIKALRKELGLNQTDFGQRLGIKQGTVAGYETGAKNPMDSVLVSICREFDVNEEWLRDGIGEMFQPMTRREKISRFAGKLIKEEDESFKVRLFEILAELDESEWEVLEGIAKKAIKKD